MALEELQNGRYHLLRLLGSGGMGEVYLMEDTRVNRQVAIKVIRSENPAYADQERMKDAARLFQREARAIAALEHPNILPLYDFGEEELDGVTVTYMVMPYCSEGSLASWVRQRSSGERLTPQDISYLIDQAAEALQYAHDQQVIHLDVKPSNFLLRSNKKKPRRPTLLLADFGIARSFTTISSSSRTIRGTPTSMAPEQWSGEPVLATDQYALAVMAYEMLTGQPPFAGSMEQLMYRHFAVEPPPPSQANPRLSPALDAVLLRALKKKPAERFPSIVAFASAFAEAAQEASGAEQAAAGVQVNIATGPSESDPGISQVLTVVGGEQTLVPSEANVDVADSGRQSEEREASTPPGALVLPNSGEQLTPMPVSASSEAVEPVQQGVLQRAGRSSEAVSEYNSPTVSVTRGPEPLQQEAPARKKSSNLRLVSILLVAVLLVALFASAMYFISTRQGNSPATANSASSTSTAALTPTSVPTPTPGITPTPPPGLYIAGTYNGSMTNQDTYQSTQISVHVVQSKGSGLLSGSVKFSPSTTAYELNGTVDKQGSFGFSVQQAKGQKPFYFSGQVEHQGGGTYLHGDYCRSTTNTCLSNDGYFNVGPGF